MIETKLRNAELADIATLLQKQHAMKHDAVVPATAIHSADGKLVVAGMGQDGPAGLPGSFTPTAVMDEGIAEKLGIPLAYMRRLRNDRPDLYDANVNGWIHGHAYFPAVTGDLDPRRFLVRTFLDSDTGEGIGRALLSDSFKVVDNLDVLVAALEGAKATGADVQVETCNLSERRMSIDLVAPQLQVNAEALLAGYRNPFANGADRAGFDRWNGVAHREGQGYDGAEMPVVWAGFRIDNSETGGGRFRISPRISIRVCKNGLVLTGDALSAVHLGAKLAEGVINWSDETQQRSLELVTSMTRDAVSSFLDVEYVKTIVDNLAAQDKPVSEPAKAVELVGKRLSYTKEQTAGILDHFIRGGQMTAFGVVNAVTSYAQAVESPDESYDLEKSAFSAFEAALAVA